MRQAVKRKVISFEMRWFDWPLYRETRHAVLECGHVLNMGDSRLNPKRMACWECEDSKSNGSTPAANTEEVPALADNAPSVHTAPRTSHRRPAPPLP